MKDTLKNLELEEARQRLDSFFFVYFDPDVRAAVRDKPERAITVIREYISEHKLTAGRLAVFGTAMSDAALTYDLLSRKKPKRVTVAL